MKINKRIYFVPAAFAGLFMLILFGAMTSGISRKPGQLWTFINADDTSGIILVKNPNGPTLGYSSASGVKILTVDGLAFKDLNRNGKLDKYEDWRLPVDERSKDLAGKMSIEQIAGLMLYSLHQAIPALPGPMGRSTYNGKPFGESGSNAWDLSDQQKSFLTNDNLRHVLITSVQTPEVAARWNNKMQALVEGIALGIPAN